ncbi:MAG: glycosyltransferase [Terracidiphilus sp.]|jgi:glycosyltransferase involved in cell wall biosynthesis
MLANRQRRVLLLIPHLGGGGAERVMELLARRLDAEKYELHLGVITQSESDCEALPPWVQLHALGVPRVRAAAIPLLRLIRQLRPDLVLSGMFHLNFLVLLLRPFLPGRTRVLVRQNGTVSSALADGRLPWYTRTLYRLLYPGADWVICQTRSMADDLARELGLRQSQLVALPNPVDLEEIRRSIGDHSELQTGSGLHLLAVGRLAREKGFDLLLQALASVRKQFPGVGLLIAGIGPEEAALRAQCRGLGLDSVVHFAGQVDRPWASSADAALFVLPSRQEGMPNTLLEAAAAGLPIVALPASGGVMELLRDQPGVWLAPEISAEALANSLLAALQGLRPGQRFAHSFVEEFSMGRAIKAYEELIDRTLEEKRGRPFTSAGSI